MNHQWFERRLTLKTTIKITYLVLVTLLSYSLFLPISSIAASNNNPSIDEILDERMKLYEPMSVQFSIPWQWIAAIDQYERSISKVKPKQRPQLGTLTGIYITNRKWAGALNPNQDEKDPNAISVFDGIGLDGDGDGLATRENDVDLMYSLLTQITANGTTDENISIGLWQYYQNSRSVQRIEQFHKIYTTFNQLNLFEHAFPLPLTATYSYRDTWGAGRGWGGKRIHEGTDLFAGYGVNVKSTCYGIIEILGWNRYGGWRVGIRDLNNHYHYYAHLQGFKEGVAIGQVVKPGEVVGWVGASGYGKVGTSGKFPPHLHYGIYSDRGYLEWAFDPYPSLKRWENEERKRLRR